MGDPGGSPFPSAAFPVPVGQPENTEAQKVLTRHPQRFHDLGTAT